MVTAPERPSHFRLHPMVKRGMMVVLVLSSVIPLYLAWVAYDSMFPWPPSYGESISSSDASRFTQVGDGDELAAMGYRPVEYVDPVQALPIRGHVPIGDVQRWTQCPEGSSGCLPSLESPDLVVSTFYNQEADRLTNVSLQGAISLVEGGSLHCVLPKDFGMTSLAQMPEVYASITDQLTDYRAHQGVDSSSRLWTCVFVRS